MHPYFKLQGIEPGRIYTARFGFIDFREEVSYDILKALYDSGSDYIKLTVEGRKNLFPAKIIEKKASIPKVKFAKDARKSRKVDK